VHNFIGCRTGIALNALREQIDLVSVFVDDSNESGQVRDIRCLVLIRLGTHPDVEVESTHTNLYTAIYRALDDAGWTLARMLMHQQAGLLNRQFKMIDDRYQALGRS